MKNLEVITDGFCPDDELISHAKHWCQRLDTYGDFQHNWKLWIRRIKRSRRNASSYEARIFSNWGEERLRVNYYAMRLDAVIDGVFMTLARLLEASSIKTHRSVLSKDIT